MRLVGFEPTAQSMPPEPLAGPLVNHLPLLIITTNSCRVLVRRAPLTVCLTAYLTSDPLCRQLVFQIFESEPSLMCLVHGEGMCSGILTHDAVGS